MSSIEEIESAVQKLPEEDYRRFREWLIDYDNHQWDKQMEENAVAGCFDEFAAEAIDDLKSGKVRDL